MGSVKHGSAITVRQPHMRGKGRIVHCHELVWETAQGMAHALYEQVMQNNGLYEHWKASYAEEFEMFKSDAAEERFVELLAPKLLERARHTLANMLAGTLDTRQKALIHDALVKDWQLRRGRAPEQRKRFKI